MSIQSLPETTARSGGRAPGLRSSVGTWFAALSDNQLATLIGAVLALIGAWPLLIVRLAPYQDLPDHLATVCVLLDPAKYPEFIANGWLKANSLLVSLLYVLARGIGVMGAGRVVPFLVVGATAFALPRFVLAFTDRRRMLVASLFMAPMVHHWWMVMGMLNFALGFALGLVLLIVLARQADQPTVRRGYAIVALSALLWFTHGLTLLFVGLLAGIEVVARALRAGLAVRGEGAVQGAPLDSSSLREWQRWAGTLRERAAAIGAELLRTRRVLLPLVPMGLVTLSTIVRHHQFGHVDLVKYQPIALASYDLWAHWFLGLSFFSAAGLVTALLLAFFAARGVRTPVPMFSIWALVVLAAFYYFMPLTVPGVGYLCERALPFLWAWALVHVPARLPRWTPQLLVASSVAWSIGLAIDLRRGAADVEDFIAAAPEIPAGAHLLAINYESRGRATNTFSLVHASGLYTVLSGAHPLDLWADSTSMPIMHKRAPRSFVEDPVRIREFQGVAHDPKGYCHVLEQTGFSDVECAERWRDAWLEFWDEVSSRYDYVLLSKFTPELRAMVPADFLSRGMRGSVELFVNPSAARKNKKAPPPSLSASLERAAAWPTTPTTRRPPSALALPVAR